MTLEQPTQDRAPQPVHGDESINSLAQKIYQIRAEDLVLERRIHEKSSRGETYDEETAGLHENNEKVIRYRQQLIERARETGADISGIIESLR